ncbi:MAG: type I-E CRISPR-associated endoribonuclease Cas2 [Candidatus Sumerlaeia bacterium]|nr:type I-E CRISPR-associated endoribonuclease Cas2 [Candidatus Sumerlaeia bacterium]
MMVLILEKVPESLRGELSRWLLEPKSGVFIGNVSTLVREKIWELVQERLRPSSGAVLAWNSPTEQGFTVLTRGKTSRELVNCDGLQLVRRPHPNPKKARVKLNASLVSFRLRQKKYDIPDVKL